MGQDSVEACCMSKDFILSVSFQDDLKASFWGSLKGERVQIFHHFFLSPGSQPANKIWRKLLGDFEISVIRLVYFWKCWSQIGLQKIIQIIGIFWGIFEKW